MPPPPPPDDAPRSPRARTGGGRGKGRPPANGAEPISLTAGSHAAPDGAGRPPLPPTAAAVSIHRPPPHSEDAEKGLLGSILLQPDEWLDRAIELITEKAFYLPAHQTLYAAMVEMRNKGTPIDYVTLTEFLRSRRELDAIGGARVVSDLYTFTPTAANAEHYLDIVREKSVLRQIIATCTECATIAYDPGEEASVVLDDVERRVLAISEARGRSAMPPMKDRVLKAIEDLEKLYERRGGITGLPTGFKELDRMTSGLHGGEMIIIAARPSMGKTALAVNIAEHVAIEGKAPVAVFSLEMSAQSLVQRLLCSRARVSMSKLRDGFLGERDFPALTQAASKLAESTFIIDDTAGLSVLELRARARRYKNIHGIQLIVIDYLQLLKSTSRRAQDNRQLEIAEISSGVKALAKELELPIIVLAQLNRQPEARTGGKPRLSDLRESGCLTGDALVYLADSGRRVPIRELAQRPRQEPVRVLAVNPDFTVSAHWMTKAFPSGRKPVFELRTRSGRTIQASANHPFLRLEGWSRLDALQPGDRIALPRRLWRESDASPAAMSDDELILLAHLLGDGCILPRQPYHYTSADEENLAVVGETARRLFGISPRLVQQSNWWHLYLPSPHRLTHGRSHPITEWFARLGLERARAPQKCLPAAIGECSDRAIALFLRHLWATDGNVSWKRIAGRLDAGNIYYSSSSRILADQVSHLLLRLGIWSSIRQTIAPRSPNPMFAVHVEGSTNQLAFLRRVGCHGGRGRIAPELIAALEKIAPNPNRDVLPREAWPLVVRPAKDERGFGWREVCTGLQTSYCGSTLFKAALSRERALRLAQFLDSPQLRQLAVSDVFWDEVDSITPLGEADVFDATVEGAHNFLANDIFVHNSLEQDADLVGLLVRSEYYAEDEEDKSEKAGEAELIIAKQRNGPTGEVKLTFLKEFTRFEDRAPEPAGGG